MTESTKEALTILGSIFLICVTSLGIVQTIHNHEITKHRMSLDLVKGCK